MDLQTSYTSVRPAVEVLYQLRPGLQARASLGTYVPVSDGESRYFYSGDQDGESGTSTANVTLESSWNYREPYLDLEIGIRNW